jgi:lysophospholipase L1-like esterase
MFPKRSTKVAAFLLVGGLFGRAASAEPTYVVALGASGIHGKGVLLSEAFPAQLENMLRADGFDVQVINAGVDGDTTTGMLFRMDSVIPAGTKITILQPGGNDFRSRKHGLSVEQHLANVEAIVSRLRAQRIQVCYVATTMPKLRLRAVMMQSRCRALTDHISSMVSTWTRSVIGSSRGAYCL